MKKKNGAIFIILILLNSLWFAGCTEYEEIRDDFGAAKSEVVSLDEIPEYTGEPYIAIDHNAPTFTEKEKASDSFETYSKLDSLGRCGTAFANVSRETMPAQERGSIGQVKPSGWHTVKYDNVDGKYLYNRCHLIGYQLTGENANPQNLMTGTRYLNMEGMLPFENMVADYIKETGNHVLFRVKPVFEGDDLIATGVEMEGLSVEDQGEGISFHVFAFNIQPGIQIQYATGESKAKTSPPAKTTSGSQIRNRPVIRGNSESKIYHCKGQANYGRMKDSKHLVVFRSEQEALDAGYRKAKR